MKNRQWNQDFPDVPEHVHQTVLNTLASLKEQRPDTHTRAMQK